MQLKSYFLIRTFGFLVLGVLVSLIFISYNSSFVNAVAINYDSGFIATTPINTVNGSVVTMDTQAIAIIDTAPIGATSIIELGWWSNGVSEDAEAYLGVYALNVTNGKPGVLLNSTNLSKGTTAGWKKVNISLSITGGTSYWLAVQLDDTATNSRGTYTDGANNGQIKISQTNLPSSWGTLLQILQDYILYMQFIQQVLLLLILVLVLL